MSERDTPAETESPAAQPHSIAQPRPAAQPRAAAPAEPPTMPQVSRDESAEGWGERHSAYDDDWYERERPPHHG